MYKPPVIAIDFEASGLDYWSPDFSVTSMAVAWRGAEGQLRSRFLKGNEVLEWLEKIKTDDVPVVVHNLGYEYGVLAYKYPACRDLRFIDTMRLSQVFDNGGDENSGLAGFSLDNCTQRILGRPSPKARFYEHLRAQGIRKGQEGENLHLLPPDLFEAYNLQDAVESLLLYERTTEYFNSIGYDWQLDHQLYTRTTKRLAMAQARGIQVDRPQLLKNRDIVAAEIKEIDVSFITRFKAEIEALETIWADAWVSGPKTEKGRQKRRMALSDHKDKWAFNINSKKHLEALFVGRLGLTPQFFTPKGSPSFKSSHLPTYGEGGRLLANRGKRGIVLKQIDALLELSAEDSCWHLSMKPTGTATGRLAGGRVE